MAKNPDRPVRVELLGVVRGGAQFLELHITTPRGTIVNAWAIGQLPPAEEGEKRSLSQEGFARATLCIAQRRDIVHALPSLRSHLSNVRYIRAVEQLSEDIMRDAPARAEAAAEEVAAEAEPVKAR